MNKYKQQFHHSLRERIISCRGILSTRVAFGAASSGSGYLRSTSEVTIWTSLDVDSITRNRFGAEKTGIKDFTVKQKAMIVKSMALFITFVIFSGRPDPKWQLNPGDPNYQKIYNLYQTAKQNNLTLPYDQIPARLGYRGFLIRENKQDPPSLILGPGTKELQKTLLQAIPENKPPKTWIANIMEALDKGEL